MRVSARRLVPLKVVAIRGNVALNMRRGDNNLAGTTLFRGSPPPGLQGPRRLRVFLLPALVLRLRQARCRQVIVTNSSPSSLEC